MTTESQSTDAEDSLVGRFLRRLGKRRLGRDLTSEEIEDLRQQVFRTSNLDDRRVLPDLEALYGESLSAESRALRTAAEILPEALAMIRAAKESLRSTKEGDSST